MTVVQTCALPIFLPVFSGTLTTLAPFFPLLFWKGVIGKFMFFLPVTLIVTLTASLLVAYIINPVFAVRFMKPHHPGEQKSIRPTLIILGIAILLGYLTSFGAGNFAVFCLLAYLANHYYFRKLIQRFQENAWPNFQNKYRKLLVWCLHRPWKMVLGTVALFILSIVLLVVRNGGVSFFPHADPNFVYVYTSLPVGTDQATTEIGRAHV